MSATLVTQDASFGQTDGHNGETFVFLGKHIHASIIGLNTTISFILGSYNNVGIIGAAGQTSVFDLGQHDTILATNPESLKIYGFQFDQGGSFTEVGITTKALLASIHPDGHGGTIVAGGVDFVGDAHLNAAQLHGLIPV